MKKKYILTISPPPKKKHQSSFWQIHLCPSCSLWCHIKYDWSRWQLKSSLGCSLLLPCFGVSSSELPSVTKTGQTSQYPLIVAQSPSHVRDPMDCNMPGLPVPHHLLEFVQVHVHCISDTIQPSRPLSPSSSSAFNLFQLQGFFQWVSWLHQVTKVFELQHQSFQWVFSVDFLLTPKATGQWLDSASLPLLLLSSSQLGG